jgi:pyruvate dehydrogenase E1 component beta subunit
MARDKSVILIGEDQALYAAGGMFGNVEPGRIRSAPISELGFCGMAVGAAMTGLRPIVDLTIASFIYLPSDPIINQAAKLRYMTGGQFKIPVVFRASMWHNQGNAAQHSDRPYPMFMNAPGLKVIVPSTPTNVKALLKAAIRDDDPVVFFEDNDLWPLKEVVSSDPNYVLPIGKANVAREGKDITFITVGACLHPALAAAKQLDAEGISSTVVDVLSLVPMDQETILNAAAKTGRVVIVDMANRTCSAASEIAARVVEGVFDSLKKPVLRVTPPDVNVPFSPALERGMFPNEKTVLAAARKLL